MTIDVRMVGADGTPVAVLPAGEIAVAPRHFSTPVSIELDVADQAYNFASAAPGFIFIITSIVLTADKNVTTDCIVEIYEASTPDATTIDKSILTIEMLKNSTTSLTGLNWRVSTGKYLNAKTDDDDVFCTIAYHIHPDDGDATAALGRGEDA